MGWSAFLTLYSKESNLTAEGLPRINVNAEDLEQLYDDLKSTFNDQWANMVILYRCAPSEVIGQINLDDLSNGVRPLDPARVQLNFGELESQRKFDTILDLFNLAIDVAEYEGVTTPDDILNTTVNSPTSLILSLIHI